MKKPRTHPGVYIQPPFFYLAVFFVSFQLHKILPLGSPFFHSLPANIISVLLVTAGMSFGLPAVWLFFKARTTVETFRPVKALQTTGIYTKSRNPMYTGLSLFYLACCLYAASWWYFITLPLLFLTMNNYVIRREEEYLEQRFGRKYSAYKEKVPRWL